MSTSAISNVLNVLPAPAAGNRADNNPASDTGTFNQALSREMDKGNASESTSLKKDSGSKNSDQSRNEAAPANGTPDNTKTASDETTAANTTSKPDDKPEEIDPAAVDMTAFLAAVAQATTAPTDATKAAVEAVSEEALPAAGIKLDASIDKDIDLKADATLPGTVTANTKEAVGKAADFVSALDKATTGNETGKQTTASIKTDVEKAIAQVVKNTEAAPTAPTTPQSLAALNQTQTLQQLTSTQAAAQSANHLQQQVGTQAWDNALGQKVVWMAQGLQQTATLTLNPPDLGPMQVTVNVQNNQATANFTAPQPEVRHALEAAMPRLREMLQDAGIQLSESSVSAGNPNQQGQASGDGRQSNGQSGHRVAGTDSDGTINVSQVPLPRSGSGMVDTFA